MALKTNIKINFHGIENQFVCYSKISQITGDKYNVNATIINYNFDNRQDIISTDAIICPVSVADNSANYIKQVYEYLKTLDEYKDAIDLLDEGQTT